MSKAKLPALPRISTSDAALNRWIAAVTERLEVREGSRGDPQERVLTVRDLDDLDFTDFKKLSRSYAGGVFGGSGSAPGDLEVNIGGISAYVSAKKFAEALTQSNLFRSLMQRIDDPDRFKDLAQEVRAVLERSVLDEAEKRGADIRRVETIIQEQSRSLAFVVEELTASIENAASGIREVQLVSATADQARAEQITQLESRLSFPVSNSELLPVPPAAPYANVGSLPVTGDPLKYYRVANPDYVVGGTEPIELLYAFNTTTALYELVGSSDGVVKTAKLEQRLTTVAGRTDGLEAQYTLKVQAGGAIAGFGIAATKNNGVPSSAFIISADKFAVVSPNYSGGLTNNPSFTNIPFGVDANGVYINGQVRIKATGPSLAEVASTSGIRITRTAENWRVNGAGQEMVISITLGILFRGSLSGTVTWSASGTTTPAPTNSNTWTVYAADQTSDTVTYTATLTVDGITYTDSVTLVRVRDGLPGAEGPRGYAGSTGSLTGYGSQYGIVSNSWSDAIANRVINNMLTGETLTSTLATTDHLLLGDTVTLSNGSNFAETRYWSGTSWLTPGVVIDGNLLVNGTVSASKVTAGSIVTGQSANANIVIGDTSFIGNIKSPFHVKKVSAAADQVLISARNDTDDSVAIWGSSVYAGGNAVSGTWHDSIANANAGRWKFIGVLGSNLFNAAVAGNVYNKANSFGGWFRYFSTESDSSNPAVVNDVRLATDVRAIVATGKVQLFGANSSLILGTNEGTAGQVLTSQGPGVTPTWTTISGGGGGSVTYSDIQTTLSPTQTTPLNLGATFRATGTTVPTSGSGVEIAYLTSSNTGFLISGTRTTGGSISSYSPLQIQGTSISLVNTAAGNVTLAVGPNIADDSLAVATTAWVRDQGYGTVTNIATSGAITGGPITTTGTISHSTSDGFLHVPATGTTNNGKVLTAGATAGSISWQTLPAATVTYSGVQSALSPTQTSQLDLGATFRSTAATPPTSGTGTELAYYGGEGFLISATRTTGGSVSAYRPLQIQGSTITFNVAPTLPTPATSTNNTTAATTAYVVSRIAQDAPTKTGSGASGTWPISISGNAATATNATNATNATTVGNKKVVGGSGISNSSGDLTVSTGLSTVEGFSAVSIDGVVCGISSVSGGSVTISTRYLSGGAKVGSQAVRWTATGT